MKKSGRSSSYGNILKNTGLFGGVQALNILVGVVRNKLVALILGPQGMGLMSLFNSTTKLVGDSTNFGIAMSGVRNISEAYDAGDAQRLNDTVLMVRSWCMITAIFGMLLCESLHLFLGWPHTPFYLPFASRISYNHYWRRACYLKRCQAVARFG